MSKLIIGSHVGLTAPDYLLGSVKEALEYDANTFMFYTGAPQNTRDTPIEKYKKDEALKLMQENNIDPKDVIVHIRYIINLCSAKEDTRKFGIEFLINEINKATELGFDKLVLHPGSRLDQELQTGIDQIIFGLNEAFKKTPQSKAIICLETMAGKGSEVGSKMDEIKAIIDGVNDQSRIGVCLDTCHLSDSGIDMVDFDNYLEEFDKKIGLEKIKCVHINDSKNPVAAHKDRHENLGYGHIGFEKLINVIYHPKLEGIPKILETPYYAHNNKDLPPYKTEIEMIKSKTWKDWRPKE